MPTANPVPATRVPTANPAPTANRLRVRSARLRTRLRRAIYLRRRLLAALCAVLAVFAGLRATAPPQQSSERVLVAAHDLAAGSRLGADDLRLADYADGTVPTGALTSGDAVGRTLAAPLRAGEPITDLRLVGAGLLAGVDPDQVALPVRIPDPGTVGLLNVGDRINLLATDPQGGGTALVASRLSVLAIPDTATEGAAGWATGAAPAGSTGRLIVVAASQREATEITDSAVLAYLTVTFAR